MWKIGNETEGQKSHGCRAGGGTQKRSMYLWNTKFVEYRNKGLDQFAAFDLVNRQALPPPYSYQVRIKWEKEYCELMGIPYGSKRGGANHTKDNQVSAVTKDNQVSAVTKDNQVSAVIKNNYINNIEETSFSLDIEKKEKIQLEKKLENQVTSKPKHYIYPYRNL